MWVCGVCVTVCFELRHYTYSLCDFGVFVDATASVRRLTGTEINFSLPHLNDHVGA